MNSRLRLETIVLLVIVFAAGAIRLAILNVPFQRDSEGCGAFYGLLARNYFRYDLATTHGIPVMSMGLGEPPVYYANHPPTTGLLIALVNAVSGYRGQYDRLPAEWQVRLPTAIFTLGCIVTIYWLLLRRKQPRAAIFAAAIFASIPMTLLFGGLADVVSPQLIFFAMLTIAAYERFHDHPGWRSFMLMAIAFTGAAIVDWPAFFLLPVLSVHYICTRGFNELKWIVGFDLAGLALFAGLYAYLTIGQPNGHWMIEQFQHRAISNIADSTQSFTFMQWLRHAVWELAVAQHTLIVSLFALVWVIIAMSRRFSRPVDRLTGLLLAWGMTHVLIGRQGVYQHEWWWWPLTPGLVIAAALMLDDLLLVLERHKFSVVGLNFTATAGLILFAVWNVQAVFGEQSSWLTPNSLNYSLKELGQVIRDSAPPDAAVMLAESDDSLAFWYYADRGVKRRIWDLTEFERRLHDDAIELSFDTQRPWNGPVKAMIVPKIYLDKLIPPLHDYLDKHYPQHEVGNLIVYDLAAKP